MARIKLIVSYDGTDFCGWQKQKDHAQASEKPSLQETMEKALEKIFREKIIISGSGRTDAGVHALAQVCHFDTKKSLPKDLCWALKSKLPDSIVAKSAWIVPDDFHATKSATHKTYRYWIWNAPRSTALLARYSQWVRNPLDLDYLNEQAKYLVGKQDFKSFQSTGTAVNSTVREVFSAQWKMKKKNLIEFEITGSGFLKQMVRNIVGTQVDFALRGYPAEKMKEIIKAQDRKKAGPAAPGQGLFLYRVYYPQSLDNKCRQI